jgi:two-component sensor histidine kinase
MSGSASRAAALFRERLTPIALDLFLEYAAARDSRRNRLRNSWFSLRDLVGVHRAVFGTGQLVKHQVGAYALARELGKSIEVSLDVASAEVTTDVLATFDLAVLHLIRNAIDHGIESPSARTLAGKPPVGKIRIRGGMTNQVLELSIEDDGGGIAFERVRQRAREMGLTAPSTDQASQQWVDLLCHPGLSTRRQATYVSGRGAGLDAVAASVTEIGGSLTMSSRAGAGTTWTIKIPISPLQISGHLFRAPGVPAPILVDQNWQVVGYETGEAPEVDIAALLGFGIDDAAPGLSLMFVRDDRSITIRAEGTGARVEARKLVVTPSSEIAEIVTNDGIEGLLLRPDNLRPR